MAHVYLTRNDIKLGFSQGQLIVKDANGDTDYRFPFCNVDSVNVFGEVPIVHPANTRMSLIVCPYWLLH